MITPKVFFFIWRPYDPLSSSYYDHVDDVGDNYGDGSDDEGDDDDVQGIRLWSTLVGGKIDRGGIPTGREEVPLPSLSSKLHFSLQPLWGIAQQFQTGTLELLGNNTRTPT